MILPAPKRRAIPVSIKLAVCLRTLGVKESEIDWSHEPALGLRAINGADYDPPQHDPSCIEIRRKADHAHITFRDNGTGRSDITTIAKVRRLTKEQEEFQRKVLSRPCGAKRQPTGNFPAGRKMQSRNEFRRKER